MCYITRIWFYLPLTYHQAAFNDNRGTTSTSLTCAQRPIRRSLWARNAVACSSNCWYRLSTSKAFAMNHDYELVALERRIGFNRLLLLLHSLVGHSDRSLWQEKSIERWRCIGWVRTNDVSQRRWRHINSQSQLKQQQQPCHYVSYTGTSFKSPSALIHLLSEAAPCYNFPSTRRRLLVCSKTVDKVVWITFAVAAKNIQLKSVVCSELILDVWPEGH